MTNILNKPYTDKDYADFAVMANTNGQRIEQNDETLFALYPYEKIQNGTIVDLSSNEEYKVKVLTEQNAIKKVDLQSQIDKLDLKSIRALREGGIKDESTGQTWVEYYTSQIIELRTKISNL